MLYFSRFLLLFVRGFFEFHCVWEGGRFGVGCLVFSSFWEFLDLVVSYVWVFF